MNQSFETAATPDLSRRRAVQAAGALTLLGASLPAWAQKQPKEGVEYRLVSPPQPTEGKGKIEVTEFFWYACPHCYDFQPAVERWLKTIPADVYWHRVPVAFSADREPHSRIFYALEAMGLLQSLHQKVFTALVAERQRLYTADAIIEFMGKNGVDTKKFADTYNSFGVVSRAQSARRIVEAYKVDGTPAVAVGGLYYTSPAMARGFDACFQVVDYLLAQIRRSGGAK